MVGGEPKSAFYLGLSVVGRLVACRLALLPVEKHGGFVAANLETGNARGLLMCVLKVTFAGLVLRRRLRWFCGRATDIKFKRDVSFRGVIIYGEAKIMCSDFNPLNSYYSPVPSGNNGFH